MAPSSVASFKKRIRNQTVEQLLRRGKYLRFCLESGLELIIHLRMTGKLIHLWEDPADARHLRLVFGLDDGTNLAFYDQRRFGRIWFLAPDESGDYWKRLGPEPLERSFTPALFKRMLSGRKIAIKPLLLDQRFVAGIGNIYADEALYRAGIHPLRPADAINNEEARGLVGAIKETLRRAIQLEGSSVDTYRTARGERGRFQETLQVHRREGESCPAGCGKVEKIRVGGRGTYFCPVCQS